MILENDENRITPACAGKSYDVRAARIAAGDHPRVCGEKIFSKTTAETFTGSPPPVRGKDELVYLCNADMRITPACAGKRHFIYRFGFA